MADASTRADTSSATRIRVGSIAGIAVDLDWSLLIIFALITGVLAVGLFPAWHPEWPVALYWLAGLTAAVLFLTSVLAHEFSHALVGRLRGISIRHITLFVFGGMAHMESEPQQWRDELYMSIAGPLASLAIGIGCLILARLLVGPIEIDPAAPEVFLAQLGLAPSVLLWLGQINIILAVFNMVPGFPLDGGRVLRALLWGMTGDLRRATRWASAGGQMFAWILIGMGIAMAIGVRVPVFGAGLLPGVWLMFIGWFLNNAALTSYRQLLTRDALESVPVARLMTTSLTSVAEDLPVSELVERHLLHSEQRAYPVEQHAGGPVTGLVSLQDVRLLPREGWARTRVAEIMTPIDRLVTITPQEDALEALELLGRGNLNQVPVMEQGRVLGMVRREDILRWLSIHGDTRRDH